MRWVEVRGKRRGGGGVQSEETREPHTSPPLVYESLNVPVVIFSAPINNGPAFDLCPPIDNNNRATRLAQCRIGAGLILSLTWLEPMASALHG